MLRKDSIATFAALLFGLMLGGCGEPADCEGTTCTTDHDDAGGARQDAGAMDANLPDASHCISMCTGRVCGSDGCGGSCAPGCGSGESCSAAGRCVPDGCIAHCAGRECGLDPNCGQSCGSCEASETCNSAGTCESPPIADAGIDSGPSMTDAEAPFDFFFCHVSLEGRCYELWWGLDTVEAREFCTGVGGAFSINTACPSTRRVGSCDLRGNGSIIQLYYARPFHGSTVPWTAATAEADCGGVFRAD